MAVINNGLEVTKHRLELLSTITKRTVDLLLNQVDEGVLKHIKSNAELQTFHKDIDALIGAKLKKKFKIH